MHESLSYAHQHSPVRGPPPQIGAREIGRHSPDHCTGQHPCFRPGGLGEGCGERESRSESDTEST